MTATAQLLEQATTLRTQMRAGIYGDEAEVLRALIAESALDLGIRETISENAAKLVETVRANSEHTVMESFLTEYGLSTSEGIALMCLAEALLRVPDAPTLNTLIADKIASGHWGEHLGQSASGIVNASSWALMLTGRVIAEPTHQTMTATLRRLVKRLGEPVIRTAIGQIMKELGRQFVLGRSIEEAITRAQKLEKEGYSYSYDMLSEAACTDADAHRYHQNYSIAIEAIAQRCKGGVPQRNPDISVRLSALHPRYEYGKKEQVMTELVARTASLARQAKAANMGFNVDSEEAERLDLSLDVIEAVLSSPDLADWDGFGVVVQAYGKRARFVLDWFYNLAQRLDRKIRVRLVKGAYWDTEIKRAQTLGVRDFPVFTRKENTDVSYLCCAQKLLKMTDRIYPQFATHNAHTAAAILALSKQGQTRNSPDSFEFQRLHGMGEAMHDTLLKRDGNTTGCRIYAPVGVHRDLLPYLMRRLLENGANSSFVHQIADARILPAQIATDPFTKVERHLQEGRATNPTLAKPVAIFGPNRQNAKGWDLTDPLDIENLDKGRAPFRTHQWTAAPLIDGPVTGGIAKKVINPADPLDQVGTSIEASPTDIETALNVAVQGAKAWGNRSVQERADCLRRTADLFEEHAMELCALACREAGKTVLDAISEVREVVDFCRFYANSCEDLGDQAQGRGVVGCISPWNFPLAIFSGQVVAALAAGNAVLAKPAGQTPLIAARATELMHTAGIPKSALQLLPGQGRTVGVALTSDSRISGLCFTGSNATALHINRTMAEHLEPDAPLVAETGGLNAMIVDSTALPEQVVRDVVASAFQSAGQRCSALRVLYVQNDIKDRLLTMLYGAMDRIELGHPWALSVDVGPVIDKQAHDNIESHCASFAKKGRILKRLNKPEQGLFVPPTVIGLESIRELDDEIFGPVLHVVGFDAQDLDQVIDDINAKGFGLTFGLHTRIDSRVEHVVRRIKVGNLYINRNQIGAVVGSQPFGGEGLSGTGPKAGGPHYVARFCQERPLDNCATPETSSALLSVDKIQHAIHRVQVSGQCVDDLPSVKGLPPALSESLRSFDLSTRDMPGPTGESNHLSLHPRGTVLCLGPCVEDLIWQVSHALYAGNRVVAIAHTTQDADQLSAFRGPLDILCGHVEAATLRELDGLDVVALSNRDHHFAQQCRKALAARDGALIPLASGFDPLRLVQERHLCIDTTAAGGNAALLAQTNP